MSFVFEPIPETDLLRIDFEKQIKQLSDHGSVPGNWIVDRERDVYLVCYATRTGHPEGRPSQFGFGYKGLGVTELRVLEKSDPKNKWGELYQILPIMFRPQHEAHREAMLPLIEEAMVAYGLNFPHSGIKAVTVEFLK